MTILSNQSEKTLSQWVAKIKSSAKALGFQQVGITDTDLSQYQPRFVAWLEQGFAGEMHYLKKHGDKRYQPGMLLPGTLRVISVRMDYLPPETALVKLLREPNKGYVARYALGRDYHRLMRKRLDQLALQIKSLIGPLGYRAFCDSAPVLEKPLAEKAGLGWIGKHTNLINAKAGSWFFLGEIYIDMPLPIDAPMTRSHCGSCTVCLDVCPTKAIIAPFQLDARRCISYLTIELKEAIPIELRPLIGNRIFGCDDCQLFCPWNKFAKTTTEPDFQPRHQLQAPDLITLFNWTETEFLKKTEGSAIRRIGYDRWLRNIAVALGNAPANTHIMNALKNKYAHTSALVQEHIQWALARQVCL